MEPWNAAIASAVLMGLVLTCHRRLRAILPEDPPDTIGRHRHPHPTPMAGFIPALLAVAALAILSSAAWLIAGVGIATAVGYLDDQGKAENHEMVWHHKGLGLLAATACATVYLTLHHDLTPAQCLGVMVWLFALTNAVNFLDNTDGVTAAAGGLGLLFATGGEGAMAFVGMAFLGFLPFNWPRAVAFLGDSGSLCLGLCLSVASLEFGLRSTGELFHLASLVPMMVFAVDFVQVLAARLLLGVPPWVGDRRHLTHVLINLGVPRWSVAPVFAGLAYLACRYLAT